MAKVLVVDDSPVDRQLVVRLLEKRPGLTAVEKRTNLTTASAGDGREALGVIDRDPPDLVVTDLQMPGMNGLELVEALKIQHPGLPVILMTAHGSEDIAVLALQRGASSYVPKRHLARDLLETVESVLNMARLERNTQRVLDCMEETTARFVLENDPSLVMPLVGQLEEPLKALKLTNANGLLRVAVALREALLNAIEHGNLELSGQLREQDEKGYRRQAEERRQQEPYRSRRVTLDARFTRRQAVYVIRDQGPGFDLSLLPDPNNPAHLETGKRGLMLIRTFMDEVRYANNGTEVTLVRNRD